MSEQTNPLEILSAAMERARAGDWRRTQELCAELGNHPSPIGVVARLNILICHYHLGHTKLIPERALPLLSYLPVTGWLPCAGLALLAARKNGELAKLKPLVMALADPKYQAWDLPTVPTYVMLEPKIASCIVLESTDAALMSEIVQEFLSAGGLSADEQAKLQSLATRYLERAVATADHQLERSGVTRPQRPWWKFW
jgi:hypothetical protein